MRSAFVAAAFAAGALAVPLMERDVVYETDIVYATAYVTVTEGDVAPTVAPVATTTSVKQNNNKHYGHRKPKTSKSVESPQENEAGGYTSYFSWATTWTESSAPAATSQAEQQQPQAYTSQEEAAPAPTSEAPQSYDEPKPTSSEAAPSSAPASSASDAKPSDYISRALHHHNIHRANHSAPAVTWSDELAETAQNIANSCRYEHDTKTGPSSDYGQNIAAGVKADNISAVITELFYNGEVALFGNQYGLGDKSTVDDAQFHEWGHFSQIVWKATTEIGCATKDCSSGGLALTGGNVSPHFTVCNYKAQGKMLIAFPKAQNKANNFSGNDNSPGKYNANVLKPRGDATCYWNDGE